MSEALDLIDAAASLLGDAASAVEIAQRLGGVIQEVGGTVLVSGTPVGDAHVVRASGSDLPCYVTLTLTAGVPVTELEGHLGPGRWRPGDEDRSGRSLLFRLERGELADVTLVARVQPGADAAYEILLRRDPR